MATNFLLEKKYLLHVCKKQTNYMYLYQFKCYSKNIMKTMKV